MGRERFPAYLCVAHKQANLEVKPDDFEYAPFAQEGGLGKVHQAFGSELNMIIDELNGVSAA